MGYILYQGKKQVINLINKEEITMAAFEQVSLNIPAPEDRPPIDPNAERTLGFVVKRPEEKMYILLFYFSDECKEFEIVTGRNEAREVGKSYTQEGADLRRSIVLVEGNPIERSVTLYDFMKQMEKYFEDATFSVDEFLIGDDDDEQSLLNNDFEIGIGREPEASFNSTTVYDESEEVDV